MRHTIWEHVQITSLCAVCVPFKSNVFILINQNVSGMLTLLPIEVKREKERGERSESSGFSGERSER